MTKLHCIYALFCVCYVSCMLYHGCLRSQRSAWPRCTLWLRAPLWIWPKIICCDGVDSRQQNCLYIAAQRGNGAPLSPQRSCATKRATPALPKGAGTRTAHCKQEPHPAAQSWCTRQYRQLTGGCIAPDSVQALQQIIMGKAITDTRSSTRRRSSRIHQGFQYGRPSVDSDHAH